MSYKGFKHSDKSKKKMSETRSRGIAEGRILFKMPPSMKGKKQTPEWKEKIRLANLGSKRNEKSRRKMSEVHLGKILPERSKEKHWNWKGGISNNPYPKIFNKLLKFKIRQRDNFTCCLCSISEEEHKKKNGRVLSINHIDFNKNNCDVDNLNTLCARCNTLINKDREKWIKYFKNK